MIRIITMGLWTLVLSLFWLPLIRAAFDGTSYRWAFEFFGYGLAGEGLDWNYGLLILANCLSAVILITGWRQIRRPFQLAAISVAMFLFVDASRTFLQGRSFAFQGDTLALAFDATTIYLALGSAVLGFSIAHAIRMQGPLKSTRSGRKILLAALALLPLQFVLLHFGEMTSIRDAAGVILTLLQFALFNLGLSLKERIRS